MKFHLKNRLHGLQRREVPLFPLVSLFLVITLILAAGYFYFTLQEPINENLQAIGINPLQIDVSEIEYYQSVEAGKVIIQFQLLGLNKSG